MIYLISRHQGAVHWLQQQIQEPCKLLERLKDDITFQPNDWIIGTLPTQKIADVCAQGARFFLIEMQVPDHLRGQELTYSDMIALNAKLVEYTVKKLGNWKS